MKIYLIGTGMNGRGTLTAAARKAVEDSELLIGAQRMLEPFRETGKKTVCAYLPQDISDILAAEKPGTAAVLLSGDTGFFSGATKLRGTLDGCEVETVCGISSAAYLCAKAGMTYENMKFISLHGRTSMQGNIAVNVRMNEKCFFLLGGCTNAVRMPCVSEQVQTAKTFTAADVCQRLCEYGMPDVSVIIGERLGYDNEKISAGKAADFKNVTTDGLCSMIAVNADYLRHIPSCISDGSFERADIPMTKSAVRGNIVAGLDIGRDSVCWDIGCGTGSVSVETAFRCPDGKVYAFDKKPEAAALTAANARRFGCDNIIALTAELPRLPDNIPAPDKVFIGGSSGSIHEIFALIKERSPHADITVSAVSTETLTQAAAAFEEFGGRCEITQLAVTETRKIGGHTMFRAQNPVFIISG